MRKSTTSLVSSDLREIAPESGFFGRDLGFYRQNLGFSLDYGFSPVGSGFSGFWGEKPKLTRRSRFLVEKIRRRPPE